MIYCGVLCYTVVYCSLLFYTITLSCSLSVIVSTFSGNLVKTPPLQTTMRVSGLPVTILSTQHCNDHSTQTRCGMRVNCLNLIPRPLLPSSVCSSLPLLIPSFSLSPYHPFLSSLPHFLLPFFPPFLPSSPPRFLPPPSLFPLPSILPSLPPSFTPSLLHSLPLSHLSSLPHSGGKDKRVVVHLLR